MSINRQILKFAIPNIVSSITVPLLGLVDMALMGHLESVVYIGAISLGNALFSMIYWNFGFLRMSTSGLAAQAYGKKDTENSARLLVQSLAIAIIGGILLWILQRPVENLGFYLLGGSEEVSELAINYFRIRVWAAPATISIYAFSGWFLGMHNAKSPMAVAIVINILNILFNAIFVLGFKMTSNGVALGTVIAQCGGMILFFVYLFKHFPNVVKAVRVKFITQLKQYKSFLSVSGDIFFRTLCIIFTFTFFTSKSAAQGDVILGVNSLFREYIMLFALIMDGFAYAAEPITGSLYAKKEFSLLKKSIRYLFVWAVGVMLLSSFAFYFGGTPLLNLLTDQESIREAAKPYMPYAALIPITGFAAFMWDGIYIGLTQSRQMLISVVCSTFLLFIPIYFFLEPTYGNHALWWAMLSLFAGRGVIQSILSKRWIYALLK